MTERGQFVSATQVTGNITLYLDGQAVPACAGETVIAALLRDGAVLGRSEFDGAPRAGFCLMGACQDCTIWEEGAGRLRACMTEVRDGMRLTRQSPLAGLPPAMQDTGHD